MNTLFLASKGKKEAQARLEKYVCLLDKWRRITNLISNESFEDIWERHVLDSFRLYEQMPLASSWADIGSGAGFPSVIIANLLAEVPGAQVHCIEIDRRKCSFLREVTSQLEIPLKIHNVRAQSFDISSLGEIDVVTARAFSSISDILQIAGPLLSKGAIVVLPRGRSGYDEVAQLDNERYTVTITPNPSAGGGIFVRIKPRAQHS